MPQNKAGIKIPIQDPQSGRVYEVLWTQLDKQPTRWDLLAEVERMKQREILTSGVDKNPFKSPLADIGLEPGNNLVRRSAEALQKPAYKWETREPSIGADPGRIPVLSSIAGWLRKHDPRQVSDPEAFAERFKAYPGLIAGSLLSDQASPASVFFNLAGGLAASKALKGSIEASKKVKAFKNVPKAVIPEEVTMTLATANISSPEWKAAAKKALQAGGVDQFPGVELLEDNVKIVQKRPKPTGPQQLDLDLAGEGNKTQVGVGPDKKAYTPFTVKLLNQDFSKNILPFLKSYVDKRNSADMVREMVGRKLGALKEQGWNAVETYQGGDRTGMLADVEKMLKEDWIQRAIVGDTSGFKQNYLPQIWENNPENIQKVFGLKKTPKLAPEIAGLDPKRRAGIRPSFTKKSTFVDYASGKAVGMNPKYDNIVDIVADHMVASNKFQADKSLLNFLKANKLIAKNGSRAAREGGFQIVEGLPGVRIKGKKGSGLVNYAAHPDVAAYLNNYFKSPDPAWKWLGNWSNLFKNISMGAGIPETIINAHGFNIGKRAFDARGMKGAWDYLTTGITKGGAKEGYEQVFNNPGNVKTLLDLSKRGYVGNIAEDFRHIGGKTGLEFGEQLRNDPSRLKRGLGQVEGWLSEHIERPLFGYKLPATKAKFALSRMDELMSQGISREAALRQVADESNTFFGGMNYVRNYDPSKVASVSTPGKKNPFAAPFATGGMDRNMDQAVRSVILAPDWFGTNMKYGKNAYKSMFGAADPIYAKAAARNAVLRNAARAETSYALNQKEMDRQKASESLLMPIGKTAGGKRRREGDLFGTADEWMRLPNQVLEDAWDKKVSPPNRLLLNRLNPLSRGIASILFNRDYNENRLYGTDNWGNPMPWQKSAYNIARTLGTPLTHPVLGNAMSFATGDIGPEEAIMQSLELPIKYRYISQPKGRKSTNPFANPYQYSNPYSGLFR